MEAINNFLVKVGGASQAEAPWYIKNIKFITIVVSILTMVLGFIMCLSIIWLSVFCLIGGLLQIIAGLLILSVEAPNLFKKFSFMSVFDEKIGKRVFWVRSVFYILVIIPALLFCRAWESIVASTLIILIAVLYGIMSLMHTQTTEETTATSPTQQTPQSIPA